MWNYNIFSYRIIIMKSLSFLLFINIVLWTTNGYHISNIVYKPTQILFATKWIDSQGQDYDVSAVDKTKLKIVSYNTLGPLHGESTKHAYAPVSVTKWTRRRDKIINELKALSADILCLQEVSYKSLKETFIPGLKHMGLELATYASPKQSDRSRNSFGHKQIGCAIFTSTAKCKIIVSKNILLRDYSGVENSACPKFKYDVKGKHNPMAMVCIQVKDSNQTMIVGNTHLFWDPNRADIKTVQVAATMRALSTFSQLSVRELQRLQQKHSPIVSNNKNNDDVISTSPANTTTTTTTATTTNTNTNTNTTKTIDPSNIQAVSISPPTPSLLSNSIQSIVSKSKLPISSTSIYKSKTTTNIQKQLHKKQNKGAKGFKVYPINDKSMTSTTTTATSTLSPSTSVIESKLPAISTSISTSTSTAVLDPIQSIEAHHSTSDEDDEDDDDNDDDHIRIDYKLPETMTDSDEENIDDNIDGDGDDNSDDDNDDRADNHHDDTENNGIIDYKDDINTSYTSSTASYDTHSHSSSSPSTMNDPPPIMDVPMVLCGDFNTFLEIESYGNSNGYIPSSLLELLRTGRLDRSHPQHPDEWSSRDSANSNPRLGPLIMPSDKNLRFENAYLLEEFTPFKPLFTTKTDEFQGWIDHIWINRHVKIHSVLVPPICANDLEANLMARCFPPIPNHMYPSDHIPLGMVVSIDHNNPHQLHIHPHQDN